MKQRWLGSLAAGVLAVSCGREESTAPPAAASSREALNADAASNAYRELGRTLAQSLRDPSLRALIHQEMARSDVKEGKLHLQNFLRGAGASLMRGMALATRGSEQDLSRLLHQLGPAELYMPVAAHRERWDGGPGLIIATQREEHETPLGVDLEGRPVALSLKAPPEVPTLVIVPAESFDENGLAYGSRSEVTTSGSWTGMWINSLHTNAGQYEPWTKGSPEFELHVERANSNPRVSIVCADEDRAIEPYRWNMDGDNYSAPFLAAEQAQLPVGAGHVVSLWEDDDGRCSIRADKDYVKLTVDAFTNAYGAFKLIQSKEYENGQIIVKVYNAFIAARSLIEGGDDYVGTSAGEVNLTSGPQQFTFMSENMSPSGWVILEWKTDTAH
ncbi:hypothetical protein [Hyalangium rubrum]|uniref:Lipoprotein n=1 Tax=Hyalangium rubrum TaxID=3103134 RepID=A0ABU5HGN5_9BACT|nr:hypothetical protein [Hyalangium sp. s54d21]MDY7232003.1 hypothetical protein [Hyalangium sp. s54d21]